MQNRKCCPLSFSAKMILSVLRAVKKSGLRKGPGTDYDDEVGKARAYNRKHPYREPRCVGASAMTLYAGNYPCLLMKRERDRLTDGAILFLHGGGDRDVWKPEVSFARRYGKRAGMDVFYPLYPPFTEASPEEAADFIFQVYRGIVKRYGADSTAVVGGSYGGLLGLQLLSRINSHNAAQKSAHNAAAEGDPVPMPGLLLLNSPFAYPKTAEEWALAERLEAEDPILPVGAYRYMRGMPRETAPDTPDSLLYPADMDFHGAPETYVFYADEACYAVADAIRQSFARDGAGERMHMHIEPGMMHCYAAAPVFRESRRDFNKEIKRLKRMGG